MNEDDTFRILSRPDIHEMVKIYTEFKKDHVGVYDTRWNIELVRKYKWDWIEFLVAKKAAGYVF